MKCFVVAMVAILVTGCGDDVLPPRSQDLLSTDPTFLKFDDDAFATVEKQASFWAVKGEARAVSLRYGDTGEAFLRFEVGAQSLSTRPDGSAINAGDSILISVRLEADQSMAVRFSPSGLKFDGSHPAVLRLSYARANPDVNGDGTVDLTDAVLETAVAVWKQEQALLPWFKIPSIQLSDDAVQADIFDFTGFGMAVN
ncbi:MAG: hypothetical protein ACT4O1_07550 [Gemmatimonadota bacterium]